MSIIDLKKFKHTYGSFPDDFKIEILDIFLQEYPGKLNNIKDLVKNNNRVELARAAHSLKGVVSSIHAEECRLICCEIEKTAAKASETDLISLSDQLARVLEVVRKDIETLKEELRK